MEEGVENASGIITRSLFDLQRFLVCARIASSDPITNDWKKSISAIVGSSASARVSLVMKSNNTIRTGLVFLPTCFFLKFAKQTLKIPTMRSSV